MCSLTSISTAKKWFDYVPVNQYLPHPENGFITYTLTSITLPSTWINYGHAKQYVRHRFQPTNIVTAGEGLRYTQGPG